MTLIGSGMTKTQSQRNNNNKSFWGALHGHPPSRRAGLGSGVDSGRRSGDGMVAATELRESTEVIGQTGFGEGNSL